MGIAVGVGQKVFGWDGKSVELPWRLYKGETIAEARDGWFVNAGTDLVVVDRKTFAHPERYITLEDHKKAFKSRAKGAR